MTHRFGVDSTAFLVIVLMAWAALLGSGAFAASAQDLLQQTMQVDTVRVEVTWVGSRAELEAKRREYGAPRPRSTVIQTRLEAFSVLGSRNGELVCVIFAPKPERFDDRSNTTLGHELLHCLGFSHRGG